MHPSHVTRFSFDASTWDVMCVNCHHTDVVPGGWGELAKPCPVPPEKRLTLAQYYKQQEQQRCK